MTYLEKWLNHNVWDGEDRSGCKNDRANFNPDDLLELFTDCHEDLQLELNRAQSRIEELETALTESTQKLEKACSVLERANALTETQARIIRRLVDENLEES